MLRHWELSGTGLVRISLAFKFAVMAACWLCGASQPLGAVEKLLDGGFETSTPNGMFPDSGFWIPSSAGPGAAAICTTTAGRNGNGLTTNGLWNFTGMSSNEWWCAPYQETPTYTGRVFMASSSIRTPPGQMFVAGSKAFVRVDFLGATTNVLASYQSGMLTATNHTWAQFQVTTGPAPAGTTRVVYMCYVSKPSSSNGVTVVNFDDCSLIDVQENLLNAGFGQVYDRPGIGPFPTNWNGDWIGNGGAVAIAPPDEPGKVLWEYTGTHTGSGTDTNWWVAIRQQTTNGPGDAFQASASIRTPPGQPWVTGSYAYFNVMFVNASNVSLGSYQSSALTAPNTNWTRFELTTGPAPTNTTRVRFICLLIKPQGSNGQSIVNFDNCSLASITIPGARVSSRALGIAATQTQTSFELRNTGKAPLTWQIVESIPWLTAPISSGTINPLSAQTISLTVNRTGLSGTSAIKGSFTLKTNDKDIPIDVYLDMPAPTPPALPAEVRLYGRQMRMRDRLPDGTLSAPYHYAIKGAAWSPASIGSTSGSSARRLEFDKWYVADIQLHRAMNANTVYTFLDFGTDPTNFAVLDNLYKNGMKAIVTVDEDGTGNSNRLQQVVTAYRNHPAILAWAIGNEWNINLYHQTYSNLVDAANATESLARQAKALDPNHPVVAIYGDIDIPCLNPLRKIDENQCTNGVGQLYSVISTERIVNDMCPSVDFWGLNIYRGGSFGAVFNQWSSISSKPMYFSEYGTDAYRSTFFGTIIDGAEDEAAQAANNRGLWNEIVTNLSALNLSGVCLGGTVFEWNDEWWKVHPENGGSSDVQENLGFGGGFLPDNFANEEWFAITAVDRRVRQSYLNFQTDFAAVVPPADLNHDGIPDVWEYQIIDANATDSLRQLSDVLPGDDFDGDHASNYNEYIADTDPTSALSVLRLGSIIRSNQVIRLQWIGGINATQYLERSYSLNPTSQWVTILTNNPPTPITNQFAEPTGGSLSNRFYRIRVAR